MDVVCLGILVSDVFLAPVDSLPAAGELKTIDGLVPGAGGCAANVARCLRKLRRSVAIAGMVGNDKFGDHVIEELGAYGVDVAQVRRSEGSPTASTIIINVHGEDRRYLHCIGANRDFTARDVDLSTLDTARILYVGGYLAMPAFTAEDLSEILREAKQRSLITILDVVIPAGAENVAPAVMQVLPWVDYFLPNDDEAKVITGREDPEGQARFFGEQNLNGTFVITCGPRGSVAFHGGQILRTEPFGMAAVDESGAGDAFAAGFITGLLEQWTIPESLRLASAVGASCTRALGCIDGVFNFDEAISFLSGSMAA